MNEKSGKKNLTMNFRTGYTVGAKIEKSIKRQYAKPDFVVFRIKIYINQKIFRLPNGIRDPQKSGFRDFFIPRAFPFERNKLILPPL